MNWTEEDLNRKLQEGKIRGFTVQNKPVDQPKKRRAKYNNQKVEYEGHVFDSKREYLRYRELLLLLKAGQIGQLRLQVPYELNPGGTHSYKYIADFVYIDKDAGLIVEDCKGALTPVYKKKRRLMKKIHNITIKET